MQEVESALAGGPWPLGRIEYELLGVCVVGKESALFFHSHGW